MDNNNERISSMGHVESLLKTQNIRYLVQGLDTLLEVDLDGEKRAKVIQLRDQLNSQIVRIFDDYYYETAIQ